MGFRGMPMARLRDSASTLVGVVAVVALVCGVGVGVVAYLEHEGTAGVRAELATRVGADLALQASLTPAANPDTQDAQVRAAIASSLASSGIRFDVTRTVSGDVWVGTSDAELSVEQGVAMSVPDFPSRAELVEGAFAQNETEVAVQADAAQELRLEPGEKVVLNGATFVVSGTWRATDYLDPRWYGESIVATGFDDAYGPFVVAEQAWSRLDADARASWTVVPADISQVTSSNLDEVVRNWARIQADWRGEVDDLQGFGFKRGLSQTFSELQTRLDGQRAIEPVILTLLAALALVTAFELISLLAGIRSDDSYLRWSRGSSPGRIALRTAGDVAAAATIGAAVGCGAVVALGIAAGFGDELLRAPAQLAIVPLVAIGACALLAGLSSLRSLRALTRPSRGGRLDPRAARRVAVPGVVVLVVLAAGIAVWQLRLYGSPVIVREGVSSVDPIAVAAAAAALVALVLVLASLLPVLARRGERAFRGRSIPTALAARTLALKAARFTAPLVVVALAVGGVTVAASYSSTWSRSYDAASALRVGADVHVSSTDQLSVESQAAVRAAVGPDAASPWSRQALSLGSVSGSIVAASPLAVSTLVTPAGGLFDRESVAEAIAVAPPGPAIPEGSTALTLTVRTAGLLVPPTVSAHVVDPLGFASVVEFTAPVGDPAALKYTADLGDLAHDGLTLLSVDFALPEGSFSAPSAGLRLLALETPSGDIELGSAWIPASPGDTGLYPDGDGTGVGTTVADNVLFVRLVPSLDGTLFDRAHPPVVISQELADLLGVGVGDTVAFALEDGVERLIWDVAGVTPAIPGAPTEAAVMIDLAVVQHFQLRAAAVPPQPRDVWLASDSPDDLRAGIRPLLPANTRIDALDDPAALSVLGSPRIALWAAAGCFVILAIIAVASSTRARTRWGRADVAALRALGLSRRDQRAVPVREFAVVIGAGLLWGLIAGAAVAVLTVPQLARAAVPQRYQSIGTSVSWDFVGLAALVLVLVVGLVLLLIGVARATSAQAGSAIPSAGER